MSEFDDVIAAMQRALNAQGLPFEAHGVVGRAPYGFDTPTLRMFVKDVAALANRRMDFNAFSPAEHVHGTLADLGSAIVAYSTHGSGPGSDA